MAGIHISSGAAGIGGLVTVSGDTHTDSTGGGWRVNSDGTIDRFTQSATSYAQISASTDWVIPNVAANGTYQVRCTLNSGTINGTNAGTGTWLALSSNQEWNSTLDFNITLEVRLGTNVLDSGTYDFAIV